MDLTHSFLCFFFSSRRRHTRYWRDWSSDVCSSDLEQRAMSGDPKNPATQEIPDVHYADFARMIGLEGVRIESPDGIDAAWEEAFSADRPFVIDAVVDPEMPPLPPHITLEQAKSFMSALKGGA